MFNVFVFPLFKKRLILLPYLNIQTLEGETTTSRRNVGNQLNFSGLKFLPSPPTNFFKLDVLSCAPQEGLWNALS